jgi:DNA-binding CsgD family transcriptional regulator
VEPFREGIATHEGWRKSTIYPYVKRFGVLEQGRVAVCSGARQVAFAGAAIPEGTEFSARERTKLTETARALVVPLRVAAMLGEVQRARSALDELLEGTTDAIFALDARGAVVGTSRPAFELLRLDRALPDQLRDATRGRARVGSVAISGRTLHVSPCGEPGVRWLVAVDGSAVEAKPTLTARQRELLALLEKGLTNAEIARALGVAAPTVKTTLERLYRRAEVGNRVELLAWWRS